MTINSNIMWVILAGLALCGFVIYSSPETAIEKLPPLLLGIGLLIRQFATDSKVDEVKEAANEAKTAAKVAIVESVKSKEASRKNADALSTVAETVETVHGIVNHQKDLVTAELSESRQTNVALTREIAGLHAALIATQVAPGSKVAAKLTDEIQVHPLDTPTPAADAVKEADAAKPPTTKSPREIVPPPIDEPRVGDKS